MILLFFESTEIVVCFGLKFFLFGAKEMAKLVLSVKGEGSQKMKKCIFVL